MAEQDALEGVSDARKALAAAPDCIKILSASGTIRFINAYGLQLLEADSADDVVGKPYWGLWPVAMHASIQAAIRGAEAGNHTQIEGFRSTVKGHMRYWEARFHGIAGEAGKHEIICIARDLTDRREREVRLATAEHRLLQELEDVERRKTEFIATLAHELRNPLAPVRTGLALLKEAVDMRSVKRIREVMERQVEQMVHLVNDLLDLARVTSGKLELHKTRVDLRMIITAAIEATADIMKRFDHRLAVEVPDEPLFLVGDSTRLAQILTNLLNNAAKFTAHHGTISMRVTVAEELLTVTIADTGIGIAPDALQPIFDMFTTVGRDASGLHEGLGVGLNLVRRLVELHGGSVVAMSEGLGRGSQFVVKLPASKVEHAAPMSLAATVQTVTPVRILIVDDNHDAAMTLSLLLESQQHELQVADSGAHALGLVGNFRPDIIFLDIGMPEMDGYQVAQAIRAMPDGHKPILVALTGWGGARDRERSSAAGFNEHLTKPADLATIEAMLARVKQA